MVQTTPVVGLPPDIEVLAAEARSEGFGMLDALVKGFSDGSNRFDRDGELLLAAWDGSELVAVCGLNVDPYLSDPLIGRVRHLYVSSSHRNRGVGGALVGRIISEARGAFTKLRVRTRNSAAGAFYETLGFEPSNEPDVTHILEL